jgi:hypothetical protein
MAASYSALDGGGYEVLGLLGGPESGAGVDIQGGDRRPGRPDRRSNPTLGHGVCGRGHARGHQGRDRPGTPPDEAGALGNHRNRAGREVCALRGSFPGVQVRGEPRPQAWMARRRPMRYPLRDGAWNPRQLDSGCSAQALVSGSIHGLVKAHWQLAPAMLHSTE